MKNRLPSSRTANPRGFSAVELLMALTLATILMGAVLGLLGVLAEKRRVLVERTDHVAWHDALVEQLRQDLADARRFEVGADRLRLLGYGAKDPATHRALHQPSEVLYETVSIDDHTWLVRTETALDSRSQRNSRRELVCRGVTEMTIELPKEAIKSSRRSGRVPDGLRLVLWKRPDPKPVVELLFSRW